jgi:hypothetical protein
MTASAMDCMTYCSLREHHPFSLPMCLSDVPIPRPQATPHPLPTSLPSRHSLSFFTLFFPSASHTNSPSKYPRNHSFLSTITRGHNGLRQPPQFLLHPLILLLLAIRPTQICRSTSLPFPHKLAVFTTTTAIQDEIRRYQQQQHAAPRSSTWPRLYPPSTSRPTTRLKSSAHRRRRQPRLR